MMRLRTRYVFAGVATIDATLIFGGVPLQRYSWNVALQPSPDPTLVLLLLAANIALLLIALCGVYATMTLARRGFGLAVRRAARFFARPSRA